ncbi:MAG TPA: TraR/DksA C4-type zinc finger protein [Jatrophihabitans sp.]|nr:TraR/DksA C4-type zinc finger protein [Jatrophihabitans sp.]
MTEPLTQLRRATAEVLAQLEADHARLVAASEGANADDEHDPEGATVGFERAQLAASIERVRHQLAELTAAADRIADGSYGACERCGRPIDPERLLARPAARTCIRCAAG